MSWHQANACTNITDLAFLKADKQENNAVYSTRSHPSLRAKVMAQTFGRPYVYLAAAGTRKEQQARVFAEQDNIEQGLVCIFSQVEPCRTFSFRFEKGRPFVLSAKRKCLHLYYYFMDRELGLIHVMVQTWFPMRMKVFVNGHNWLANKLEDNGIGFTQVDNAFVWLEDVERAQRFSDRFASLDWPKILNRYARQRLRGQI